MSHNLQFANRGYQQQSSMGVLNACTGYEERGNVRFEQKCGRLGLSE